MGGGVDEVESGAVLCSGDCILTRMIGQEKQSRMWQSSRYWYSVYCYGTYLYLTYFWSTSHVIVFKLSITTIIISFTSCDATILILAVDSRSLSNMNARMDITTTSSTGTSTMSQKSIPRTSRTFIYQLPSPPVSDVRQVLIFSV